MYAVGHTCHTLISLSDSAIEKVKARKNASKVKFKTVFYRCAIKGQTWSFLEDYESAQAFITLLILDGCAA